MASASVRSSATTGGTTASTTPSVNLPGTIKAGDTIVVFFRSAAAGAIGWPDATWTEVVDASPDGADDQIGIAWRKADGTEGSTITLSSGNGRFVAVARAYKDAADPTVRAPELSSVSTATTGQPNANSISPTGGSKDYLFDTVALHEGEQTGVTSYPTNYGSDQTGLVNSGTAGPATTNVTMAAATRQATASSEDAGAWTFAGTLSNSSAYTLAVHPAEVVPAPLAPDSEFPLLPAPTPTAAMVALTIAVNLLQSTLAPVPATPTTPVLWPNPLPRRAIVTTIQTLPTDDAAQAFRQTEWPNPRPKALPGLTWVVNLTQSTLAPAVQQTPFAQTDWPNPAPLRATALSWTQSRPTFAQDATPLFAPIDPPTRRPAPPGATWTVNRLQDTLQPIQNSQTDWPLPQRAAPHTLTWIQTRPVFAADTQPFAQTDWPVPLRQKSTALSWLQARPSFAIDETPSHQTDWPIPLRQKGTALSWLQPRFLGAVDETPASQREWPVPAPAKPLALTWTQPGITAAPTPTTPPDWPLPRRATSSALSWMQAGILQPPFAQTEWPLPPRATTPALSWLQTRPVFAADQQPTPTLQWPIPGRIAPHTLTWIVQGLQATTLPPSGLPPFVPVLFPNPAPSRVQVATGWQVARPQFYVDQVPAFAASVVRPDPRVQPTATWTTNLLQSTLHPLPDGQRETTLPITPQARAQTWIVSLLETTLSTPATPITPLEWRNPDLRPRPALTWLQGRPLGAQDARLPFVQEWPLPKPLRVQPPSQVSAPPLTLATIAPTVPVLFPNPAPEPRPGHTWLVNLLETTLVPAPEVGRSTALPPSRPPMAQTWLQARPFFYSDQQPFAQYDWPNPAPLLRASDQIVFMRPALHDAGFTIRLLEIVDERLRAALTASEALRTTSVDESLRAAGAVNESLEPW